MLLLALAGLAGALLGVIFFGGLWWTVRLGSSSPRPGRWFFASLLLRVGISLGGFYLAAGGDGARLIACLTGFVLARAIVTRFTRHKASAW